MSLADKIMQLRKQRGWSQIDLADRLDVSRQSVSKWEMAQAVPELDKIIKLSELFDVTTDYLLKDDIPEPPAPEPEAAPEPEPVPEPVVREETPKKKWSTWRWIATGIAAVVFLALALIIIAAVSFNYMTDSATSDSESSMVIDALPTPSPIPAAAGTTWIIEAESTDQVYEGPMVETYTFGEGETALTGGPVSPEEMAAIAREYEPFGVTYDVQTDQWYYDGQAVRIFTDIMTSNGQPLEGGNFHGVMRSFAGTGSIDIRTIRDYDRPDSNGNGTLTGIEVFNVYSDADWEESP